MEKQADSVPECSQRSRKILIGRLIDGTGAPARRNILMTIGKGRILEMRPFLHDGAPPEDLWQDLSDSTVLPPLIDSHVHLAFSGNLHRTTQILQPQLGYESVRPLIDQHIMDHLRYGVLGVRDGGDPCGNVLHHKSKGQEIRKTALRMNAAGSAWHRDGRYGKLLGCAIQTDEEPVAVIEGGMGPGVDHIKLIQSGLNSLSDYGKQTPPQFDEHTIRRIYALSRKRGVGLMVHANGEAPVAAAIAGGCDSIEHGYFMGDENLRRLADTRITWVPTAIPMKAFADHSIRGSIEFDVARRTLEHQLEQLSKARQYGVAVALGTDSGSPGVEHGKAVWEELKLFETAGYPLEEAVSCATQNGARLLKTDLTGCLGVGMPATFIVVKGDVSEVLEAGGVEGIEA